ncbi:hypothetical protein [Streptomyces sp. MST-110588]|uniref:hypothetical protein n=1 Tax=Streptomyces sp. MST-110588 TaxID=2833628 RepID=UPI001F5E00FC|nr:hypothetical protein [Streptomyces sp. MST-110588]UNO40002.1 hypothetical protein KGS77_10860 [Streptomyces sp. MST-110588]
MSSKQKRPASKAPGTPKAARASKATGTAGATGTAEAARTRKASGTAPGSGRTAPDSGRAAGPGGPRPARLSAAAVLTGIEGLALAALGVYMLVDGLVGHPDSARQAETGGLTVLALAVLPLIAARGLWLCRRWSRGPSLITQIVALPVAWTLVNGGGALIAAGVVVALVALVVLVLLVNPTSTEALGIGPKD